MSQRITCRPLRGTLADQPPLVQAMIRGGVAKGLAAGPVGVSLQREERDMLTDEEQGAMELARAQWQPLMAKGMGVRTGMALVRARVTPEMVSRMSDAELRSVRNVGRKAAAEVRQYVPFDGADGPAMAAAAVAEPAPATEAPSAELRGDAKMLLAHAMRYAVASGLANYCLMLNAPLPAEAQAVFDVVLPDIEVSDVLEAGRVVGWEVALPAGCGLRVVQVRVE